MATSSKSPVRLYLIDGSGYLFRAYFAMARSREGLTRASDGLPVGAVLGFSNMLNKLLTDMKDEHDPTHLAVITRGKPSAIRFTLNIRPIEPQRRKT